MSAGVHPPRMRGAILDAGALFDRERVNISPKRDARLGRITDERDRRRGRIFHAGCVLDAQRIELRADRVGGLEFFKAELGNTMQAMTEVRDPRQSLQNELIGRAHVRQGYGSDGNFATAAPAAANPALPSPPRLGCRWRPG
jgi:hypothetical protein